MREREKKERRKKRKKEGGREGARKNSICEIEAGGAQSEANPSKVSETGSSGSRL
jgi:hypothetical protein